MLPARVRVLVLVPALASACAITGHPVRPASLGASRRSADLVAVIDRPGPITVETVAAADWAVDRSGLIDLKDPRARQLKDGLEPIQIYFHVLRHPTRGTFIVDTGVERALRDDPRRAAIRGFISRFMHLERMHIHVALGDWLAQHPVDGVLMTHLHLDHVSGLPDVPHGTPVYVGPGEARTRDVTTAFVRPSIDRALAGQGPVEELRIDPDPDGRFAGVLDVFGDGSLWALYVPGHTKGSMAFLARTPTGPVLLTGDTCHTAWGWTHDVAPGSYTADHRANALSLARLRRLVAEHPAIEVRLGHQPLAPASSSETVVR
jgi:glyoxylase-like metal-dependent hydrolase (beta-lactamase superfamily II)